jgi:NAD(P)-dependent dehydrogenase (short-subunit alcohol dehydrogenase family)
MRRYPRWIFACALAETIGIGAVGLIALALAAGVGEPSTLGGRVVLLAGFGAAGAIEGLALGLLQWRVLRGILPRLRRGEWVGITVAVAVIGWLAGMAGPVLSPPAAGAAAEPALLTILLMAAALGAGAGAVFGAAQWLVLRRHAPRAWRWIAIHVPGWALAMAAIFLGTSVPTPSWPAWAIAIAGAAGGALGGALLGAVTGLVVRRLDPHVDERRWSLRGKICAVTGADRGIGLEVARGLARMDATVLLLCRDVAAGRRAAATMGSADVHVVACDLAALPSVRATAAAIRERWPRLDVLVHNAGATFRDRTITVDGIEATLAVDVVGPFLLTTLLADRLSGGRVVTLTGIYHRRGRVELDDLHFERRPYRWLDANNQAQRGRLLFTAELARRAPGITAVAVHPGAVRSGAPAPLTRVQRALIATVLRPAFVRSELGAAPVVRLAADPALEPVSGRFFDRFALRADAPPRALAAGFWAACEAMTGAPLEAPPRPVSRPAGFAPGARS